MDIQYITAPVKRFISMLQRCRQRKDVVATRTIYAQIWAKGLDSHYELVNYLVSTLVACRCMVDALYTFDGLVDKNELSWTSLIQGWTECGYPANSLQCFDRMQVDSILPSKHTYVALLKACTYLNCMEHGQCLYADVVLNGLEDDPFIGNTLVCMYATCGSLKEAHHAFLKLIVRNVVSWNVLIAAYVAYGDATAALHCFWEMETQGISPDAATFACSLKACSILHDSENGLDIHHRMLCKGAEKRNSVSIALLEMYSKCGLLMEACSVFDRLPDQNIMLWTVLISGFCEHGFFCEALKYVEEMQMKGVLPDAGAFICCLKASGSAGTIQKGQHLHAEIAIRGMEKNTHINNTLFDMYVKCGLFIEAKHTFDKITTRSVVTWNVLISAYSEYGYYSEALNCLKQMQLENFSPDTATFNSTLKSCCNLGSLDNGREVHVEILKKGLEVDTCICNMLIDMYAKCVSHTEAKEVFYQLSPKNQISWNTLITGYIDSGHMTEAVKCLEEMQLSGVPMDSTTFICLLKVIGSIFPAAKGQKIHMDIVKYGLEGEQFIANGLMDMYFKCGLFSEATQLFECMPIVDVVSWSIVITGYFEYGHGELALKCLEQMQDKGFAPNLVSYNCSLKACGSIGTLDIGQTVHAQVVKTFGICEILSTIGSKVSGVNSVLDTLIDMYCKCGSVNDAHKVFKMVTATSILSWNTLMTGSAHHGDFAFVLCLFDNMCSEQIQADAVTFLCLLTACNHAGLVDEGRICLDAIEKCHGVVATIMHYNCMVDLLSRAGQLSRAIWLVRNMPFQPNLSTWCAMLGASCKFGDVDLGSYVFPCAIELNNSNVAALIVMCNMYMDTNAEPCIESWKSLYKS